MSYHADKPYGRRKTDRPLTDEKRRHLQSIRRDVDEDPTGMIRRYLRLASKALDNGEPAEQAESSSETLLDDQTQKAA
jgi:hypothetical protein